MQNAPAWPGRVTAVTGPRSTYPKTGWKRRAVNPADTTKSALFLRSACTQQ
jgi:hypothetical protein